MLLYVVGLMVQIFARSQDPSLQIWADCYNLVVDILCRVL
jgi:hypothetical protein